MGCTSSSEKEPARVLPEEAQKFVDLATKEEHAVARRLLQEWGLFVEKQSLKKSEDEDTTNPAASSIAPDGSAHQQSHYVGATAEAWVTTADTRYAHKSVDEVGQHFLHYIRFDLSERRWGGNFNYSVAGVATQGFLTVTAEVDTCSNTGGPQGSISNFYAKLHYHST